MDAEGKEDMRLSWFQRQADRQLEDFLLAHADALLVGKPDLDSLLKQYDNLTRSQVETFVTLAERISESLTEVAPSDQFVGQLRYRLREAAGLPETDSLMERVRQMSPRVQWAAGIGGATLTAGVVIMASRPIWGALEEWRSRRAATA